MITAYQTMSCGSEVARGALIVLATHQAKGFDDFTDEEPGKIFHEIPLG